MPEQQIDYDRIAAEVQGLDYDALARDVSMVPSHDNKAKPISTGGGRGTGLDLRKSERVVKESAPALGAGLAVAAGPGGIIPSLLLAGGGAFLGSRARGDDRGAATVEAIKQAGLQGGGDLAVKAGGVVARGLMKGTVPKPVAKNFDTVDIPQEMLNRGAVPGVPASARRIGRLSSEANTARETAAQTVPPMPRRKVIEGLRPIHQKATAAREPEMAGDVLDYMRKTARDLGPTPLSGAEQLARKGVKQELGQAALTSGNHRTAALMPQMQDAERGAIMSHMRETPAMASALDESQALMAVDDVMKDAAHSNPVTRARIGGLTAASMSPMGLGATAHVVNQGRKAVDPQTLRALALMALLQDQE